MWKKIRFQNGNVEKRHEHIIVKHVSVNTRSFFSTDCDNDKTSHTRLYNTTVTSTDKRFVLYDIKSSGELLSFDGRMNITTIRFRKDVHVLHTYIVLYIPQRRTDDQNIH